ncbi:hypothetical protein [Paenibacillus terrae]|nr:hypothetical protein [Paenibacillus terrae]
MQIAQVHSSFALTAFFNLMSAAGQIRFFIDSICQRQTKDKRGSLGASD